MRGSLGDIASQQPRLERSRIDLAAYLDYYQQGRLHLDQNNRRSKFDDVNDTIKPGDATCIVLTFD